MTEKTVFQLTVRDAAIGGVGVMQVTGPVGAYRFRFRYVFGTASGVLDETAVSEVCRSAERAVYRWSVPAALAAQLPEAVRGTGTMTAEACDGETCVGSGQATFAVYVPASVKPTAALETAVVSDIPAVQAWGLCVQGLSRVQYSVTAAGADGAAVRACRFSFGGQEKTGLSGVTDTIAAAGMMTPEAVVTDSRGRSVTVAGDAVEVYAYHPPVILSGSAVRCDADGAEADGGGYLKVYCHAVCADVAGHNTVAVRARWRAAGGAWSAGTVLTDGQETVLPGGFAADTVYEAELSAVDAAGGVQTVRYLLPAAGVTLHLRGGGRGAAFGKYSEKEALECAWPAVFYGGAAVSGGLTLDGKPLADALWPVGCVRFTGDGQPPQPSPEGAVWESVDCGITGICAWRRTT